MKAFIEEYGLVIVVALIAVLLLAFATPLGNYIVDGCKAFVKSITETAGSAGTTFTPPTFS